MATQGQRRREAIASLRKLRQQYRKMDTASEKVERELDRLIKRKTLVSQESLLKTAELMRAANFEMTSLNQVFRDIVIIIGQIPI